jgi:hypothetical protein
MLAALDYGRDWYSPGSFTLVNFDEAGSCRAALDGFSYSPFIGWQTLAIADWLGTEPPSDITGDPSAVKAYCHAASHIRIARLYSAVSGSLTVLSLGLLSLLLLPARPGVTLTAAALLALSGWHISESLTGTVDAASTFFIYGFFLAGVWAVQRGGVRWLLAALLMIPAIYTKYWLFAVFSLAAVLPDRLLSALTAGLRPERILILLLAYAALFGLVSNPQVPRVLIYLVPFAFYIFPPWTRLSATGRWLMLLAPWLAPLAMQSDLFVAFSSGSVEGRFGSDYGAIGWHKWLRNLINVPLVLVIGLGVPGFTAFLYGLHAAWRRLPAERAWLVLLPLPAFALYMLFLAPVTYYRHYLPLLPIACLFAALGLAQLSRPWRRWATAAVLVWQGLLGVDLVSDYHFDPRRQLVDWYAGNQPQAVLASYYVNPPPGTGARHGLFRPEYARGNAERLRQADTVILSENWYDTAFANELNGPLVGDPRRLIKTRPEDVAFYRAALDDRHPHLQRVAQLRAPSFMPELLLHRAGYGSFTQFVGDLVIFRVMP